MYSDLTAAERRARWTGTALAALLLLSGCGSGSGVGEAPPDSSYGHSQPSLGESQTGPDISSGSYGHSQPSLGESQTGPDISSGEHPSGLFQSQPYFIYKCEVTVSASRDVADPLEVQRLHTLNVCFDAFTPIVQPIQIELTGPGESDHVVEQGLPMGRWTVNSRGDMLRGVYRYRAAPNLGSPLSGSQITGEITVIPAQQPSVWQTSHTAPSGGRGLQISLAGYPAGARVQVFLYGPEVDGFRFPFARPLPQASIGPDGEATYSWQAGRDDPHGSFAIYLNPDPGCRNRICAIGG